MDELSDEWHQPLIGVQRKIDNPTDKADFNFFCDFECCQVRPWFSGYITRQDFWLHQQLHRCQWLIWRPGGFYTQCTFIPRNKEDLKLHVDEHVLIDKIPMTNYGKSVGCNECIFYCPWQTCGAKTYCSYGCKNKRHTIDHIRHHVK